MSGTTPVVGSLRSLVEEKHKYGVLLYILPCEDMCRRTSIVAVAQGGVPASPSFLNFIRARYDEGQHRPIIPLVQNAITFPADQNSQHANTHTYLTANGQRSYILDVKTTDPARIIPLNVYKPYADRAPGRAASVLNRDLGLVPLWIVTDTGLGSPVGQQGVWALQNGNVPFTHPDGTKRTSLFVRIRWPGYPDWDSQIRLDNNQKTDVFTFKRLVELVKGKVRKFINDNENRESSNPYWTVGSGRIAIEDLNLLAILEVSKGAVMPILSLRHDFVFPDLRKTHSSLQGTVLTQNESAYGVNTPNAAGSSNDSQNDDFLYYLTGTTFSSYLNGASDMNLS
ncbi:unnamed protein product [Peniophora sp. CBMAI 1063]|nr:unnamed protein product [Peniophora sp. CBMAI 1063]